MHTALVDFSNIVYRAYHNLKAQSYEVTYDFWRYNILQMLKKIHKDLEKPDMILICDSSSWRSDYWNGYKAKRKEKRKEDTGITELYTEVNLFIEELKQNFPYKIMRIDKAEADDIIGVLVLNKKPEDYITIVSADYDFIQLLQYDKVFLFHPMREMRIAREIPFEIAKKKYNSYKEYIYYHIIIAGDDDIPNIFTDVSFSKGFWEYLHGKKLFPDILKKEKDYNDLIIEWKLKNKKDFETYKKLYEAPDEEGKTKRSQAGFGYAGVTKLLKEKTFQEWAKELKDSEKLRDQIIFSNMKRNHKLIVLSKNNIPVQVQVSTMSMYNKLESVFDADKILKYFKRKSMASLFEKIEEFRI